MRERERERALLLLSSSSPPPLLTVDGGRAFCPSLWRRASFVFPRIHSLSISPSQSHSLNLAHSISLSVSLVLVLVLVLTSPGTSRGRAGTRRRVLDPPADCIGGRIGGTVGPQEELVPLGEHWYSDQINSCPVSSSLVFTRSLAARTRDVTW